MALTQGFTDMLALDPAEGLFEETTLTNCPVTQVSLTVPEKVLPQTIVSLFGEGLAGGDGRDALGDEAIKGISALTFLCDEGEQAVAAGNFVPPLTPPLPNPTSERAGRGVERAEGDGEEAREGRRRRAGPASSRCPATRATTPAGSGRFRLAATTAPPPPGRRATASGGPAWRAGATRRSCS